MRATDRSHRKDVLVEERRRRDARNATGRQALEADSERAFTRPAAAGNVADLDLMQTRRRSDFEAKPCRLPGKLKLKRAPCLAALGSDTPAKACPARSAIALQSPHP